MRWKHLPLLHDDYEFLRELLQDGEPEIQKSLLEQYADHWERGGRRAANTFIREEVEAMRHKEPEVLKRYRKVIAAGPPKVCHSCEHYADDGVCLKYEMEPPEQFASTPNSCPDWIQEVPF